MSLGEEMTCAEEEFSSFLFSDEPSCFVMTQLQNPRSGKSAALVTSRSWNTKLREATGYSCAETKLSKSVPTMPVSNVFKRCIQALTSKSISKMYTSSYIKELLKFKGTKIASQYLKFHNTVETPYSTIPYTTIFYITRWTRGPQNLPRPIRTLIVLLGFWIKQIFV